ncbi:serine/threonine-protein kinase [Streptomyces sp. G-G2]|uniref:protein kinase domain-containing protein n=1 Tax=Streptomyces sp. G-G2 TaxID=3046201 RepID=UPI0024B89B7E|nr:serine/threonine-protein kinase [Streptomyces sp. G-G2]MDJ0381455.1 serine/threonine-protein kinase [Streptomyces sp. G-G2]
MQPLEAGEPRVIGAYRLLGRLGAGGMGRVYLGRSAGGRTVAVKVVHPHFASDDEFRARFRREVAAARRVGGEWTAEVLDADPEAAVPWVATAYVAGPALDRALAAHGPLPARSVRAIGAGLARALVAVHALGLVHRDVKPSNVMLTLDGPRLIDFGIARATDGTASLTSTGVSVGSPGYMAPEQILGKGATGASDVFSLGAVLAFAATGKPPFSGDNAATLLYKVVHEEPDLSAVPAGELRELIAACLAKAAADRPAPEAVAVALAGALGAPGWLPGPLVEEASRANARLLDLDADVPDAWGAAGSSGASGLVPFATPSYGDGAGAGGSGTGSGSGAGSGPGGSLGSGGFGPADSSYSASGSASGPSYDGWRAPVGPVGPYGLPTGAGGTGGSGAGHAAGHAETAADGVGGGQRGVRLSAAGRRVSCTLVLALGAVAVALGGGLYGLGLLPTGPGGGHDVASGRPSASAPATGSSPSVSSSASPPAPGDGSAPPTRSTREDVPKEFIGTWKGSLTTNLGLPSQFEITIRAGKRGAVVARDTSVIDLLGTTYDCSGDWKLAVATDRALVLDTAGGPNPHPGICAPGSADERFSLTGSGAVHYRSGDKAAGNPEGDLTRG